MESVQEFKEGDVVRHKKDKEIMRVEIVLPHRIICAVRPHFHLSLKENVSREVFLPNELEKV